MHRLIAWLIYSDTILGQNLPFDLLNLRQYHPLMRIALDGKRHTLIDLTVLNYLDDELRPEKDLKSLSMLLRTTRYEHEKGSRYLNADDPKLHLYNAVDTHSTMANIRVFARRILRDYSHTDKLSPFCLQFYSDTLWTVIRMAEAGIPMDRHALEHYERNLLRRCATATTVARMRWDLRLEGDGSNKSKLAFMESIASYIEDAIDPDIRDHPLFQLTEIKHEISINDVNRSLFEHILGEAALDDKHTDEYLRALYLMGVHMKAQKVLSSYTFPLLRHKRKELNDRTSLLIPEIKPCPPPLLSRLSSRVANGQAHGPSSRLSSTGSAPRPAATSGGSPSGKQLIRRQRTQNQWLKKHQQHRLRRQSKKLRQKLAKRKILRVTYRSDPVLAADPWQPKDPYPLIEYGYSSWFVTPSYIKDASGSTGGTIQGRITAKGPAVQTFPETIRDCIRSRFHNGRIVWFDLSQIELRVAALLSGEDELVDAYCSPTTVDLHEQQAIQVFGKGCVAHPDFKRRYRSPAKHIRFGHLYRAGPDKLQLTVLRKAGVIVSLGFFHAVVKCRASDQPKLWAWQESMIAEARTNSYIVLPFTGQSRAFMGGEAYDISEIVNMPIQTTAGNVMLRLHAYCHHHGPDINERRPPHLMFANIYDAIGFDCRDDAAVEDATNLMDAAVMHETLNGYWFMLTLKYGRYIPLVYERTIAA